MTQVCAEQEVVERMNKQQATILSEVINEAVLVVVVEVGELIVIVSIDLVVIITVPPPVYIQATGSKEVQ